MGNTFYREKLNSQIRDAYGKVVYTYTAHHKMVDRIRKNKKSIDISQITLTALSTVGFLATVITDEVVLSWIGGITAAVSLGLNLYTKDNNLQEDIRMHESAANELWVVREKYVSLLTDFVVLPDEEISIRRDAIQEMVAEINNKYPGTDKKSYEETQKALKDNDEQTFSKGEIEKLLPQGLRN